MAGGGSCHGPRHAPADEMGQEKGFLRQRWEGIGRRRSAREGRQGAVATACWQSLRLPCGMGKARVSKAHERRRERSDLCTAMKLSSRMQGSLQSYSDRSRLFSSQVSEGLAVQTAGQRVTSALATRRSGKPSAALSPFQRALYSPLLQEV